MSRTTLSAYALIKIRNLSQINRKINESDDMESNNSINITEIEEEAMGLSDDELFDMLIEDVSNQEFIATGNHFSLREIFDVNADLFVPVHERAYENVEDEDDSDWSANEFL